MEIKDRIREVRLHYCNGDNEKFAERVGETNNATVSNWTTRNPGSLSVLNKIHKAFPEVNLDWLITGRGQMIEPIISILHNPPYREKTSDKAINLYNIEVAANLKTLFENSNQEILGRIEIPNMPICDGAVKIRGDSMYPLLKSGDIIVYKEVHDIASIFYGEMYMIEFTLNGDYHIVVKYVKRSEKEEHINKLKKDSTKDIYRRTLNYFIACVGDVPLEMINPEMIEEFDNYLRDVRKNGSTSRAIHLRQLRSFINPQIRHGNVTYKSAPFVDIVMPESKERELDITVEEFKHIRDSNFKEKPMRVARDLFCLSYYLGGINLIDLMDIDFKNATTIEYVREKSRNTKRSDKMISLTIPPEAKPIIKEWMGRNGKLDFGYDYTYDNFRNYVTHQIKRLAKRLDIDKRVVYYSARKSLVQHGFELGISLEILEYSIGQSMKKNRPIFNYVRIMRTHADQAMRLILDNLK